jgi:hypothetical protein
MYQIKGTLAALGDQFSVVVMMIRSERQLDPNDRHSSASYPWLARIIDVKLEEGSQ